MSSILCHDVCPSSTVITTVCLDSHPPIDISFTYGVLIWPLFQHHLMQITIQLPLKNPEVCRTIAFIVMYHYAEQGHAPDTPLESNTIGRYHIFLTGVCVYMHIGACARSSSVQKVARLDKKNKKVGGGNHKGKLHYKVKTKWRLNRKSGSVVAECLLWDVVGVLAFVTSHFHCHLFFLKSRETVRPSRVILASLPEHNMSNFSRD